MSYQYTGVGLGLNYTVKTPVGDQKISIPVEAMAKDAAKSVLAEIQPVLEAKIKDMLPKVIDQTWPKLEKKIGGTVDELRAKQLPIITNKVNQEIVDPALRKVAVGGVVAVGAIAALLWWSKKKA